MRCLLLMVLIFSLVPLDCSAELMDVLDFSVEGDGVTHRKVKGSADFRDRFGNVASSPFVSETGDWVLTWGSISTDTSLNEFRVSGGNLRVQDWGGVGTLTSATPWQATTDGTLDIEGIASTIDQGFNVSSEGITWFYSINGGDNVEQFLGDRTGDVSHTFSGIAISAGDQVSYGFYVNVNGAGDGADISSMSLNFFSSGGAGTPEPTSLLMFGSLGLLGLRRRSRPLK